MKDNLNILNEKNWILTDYGYFYASEKIKFIKLSSRESLKDILKVFDLISSDEKWGVICTYFSTSDLQLLREKKISYCVLENEIKIFPARNGDIMIKDGTSLRDGSFRILNPSKIISPIGLEIADTIFKLDSDEIKSTPASITKKYNISQAKLSMIMTSFRSRTLRELKEKLLDLDFLWWPNAFDNPIIKRKMTPFKTVNTRKYVLNAPLSIEQFQEKILQLKAENIEVDIGGISYLKLLGVLKTSEFDVLVKNDHLTEVIEVFNLRMAKKDDLDNLFLITPLIGDIKSEKLEVKKINKNIRFQGNTNKILSTKNTLRYLWGLNYDDERIKEERNNLLKEYLNEIRHFSN